MIHMLSGLGQSQFTPEIRPWDFRSGLTAGGFRCPSGTVPNVLPSGEVSGCKTPGLVAANGAAVANGVAPSPWPWIIGLGAAAALAYAVWG